jgi:hypothetical protein
MKFGLSMLLNEYLLPDSVEYKDSEVFQIVCPECYEPVFKVVRDNKVCYFSHYKKDKIIDTNCSLRVDSMSYADLVNISNESRGQNIDLFLSVFKEAMLSHEINGDIEKVLYLIKNINESLGFGEIKNKIADKFRELSDNDDLIMSFFDDYITETNLITKYSFLKQKEYALVLLKHLCSPKAKENLGFLICYAGIFLTTRLDTSYKTGKIADWELDMYKYLNLLLKCQSKKEFYSIYDKLIKYKLNPPWVQEKNTSMLVKIISEIAYEACGVLIRFPYFKVLKDNIQNRKNHLTTAST